MSAVPVCAKPGPYVVDVEAGREYLWCGCGRSRSQPWCDGSHDEDTAFGPISFVAPVTAEFYMCGCKRSDNKPFCFGNCRGHQRALSQAGESAAD
ncbi:MAG: CDGSH iron-sulfur domain-containing protein [Rhodospirillaceae bacterium]